MTHVDTYITKIHDAVRNHRAAVRSIKDDLYIPDRNKHIIIGQKNDEARREVERLHSEAKAAIDERKSILRPQLDAKYLPAGDVTAGIAADNQTWQRVRGLLDAGMTGQAVLEDAVSRGDLRTIKVLAQEYRAYEAAKSGSFAGADMLQDLIDEARYQTGNASYRAVADELADLDYRGYTLDMVANHGKTQVQDYWGDPNDEAYLVAHDSDTGERRMIPVD